MHTSIAPRSLSRVLVPAAAGALLLCAAPLGAQQAAGASSAQARTLVSGREVAERLDARDPVLPDDSHYDLWSYRGRAGERITVVMRSGDFDTMLSAAEPGTQDFSDTNDDGGEEGDGTNSRLVLTLPRDGEYLIRAGSYEGGATGAYTLALHSAGAAPRPSPAPSSAAAPAAPAGDGRLVSGREVRGALSASDPTLVDGTHYDVWRYSGYARERVRIAMNAAGFDAYLAIGTGDGRTLDVLATDDDGGEGTNALIEVVLPRSGEYVIRASSLHGGETGEYTLVAQGLGIDHTVSAPSPPQPRPSQPAAAAAAPARPAFTAQQAYDRARGEAVPGYRKVAEGTVVVAAAGPQSVRLDSSPGAEFMVMLFADPAQPSPTLRVRAVRGDQEAEPTSPGYTDASSTFPGARVLAYSLRAPAEAYYGDRLRLEIASAGRYPSTRVMYVVWRKY